MFHRKTSVFSGSSLAQERSNLFCLFVCFILRFLSVILYRKGIFFTQEFVLLGMQPLNSSSSCDRRRQPGAGGRMEAEEWDEWLMGDVWGPPCLPTMSSSLVPPPLHPRPPIRPNPPLRPSVSARLSGLTLCLLLLFFSLSVSPLLLFLTAAPSPRYFLRSLAPSLAPVCFNSCCRLCGAAALVLPKRSVAQTESQCCFASISVINFPMIFEFIHTNKVCWCFSRTLFVSETLLIFIQSFHSSIWR